MWGDWRQGEVWGDKGVWGHGDPSVNPNGNRGLQ